MWLWEEINKSNNNRSRNEVYIRKNTLEWNFEENKRNKGVQESVAPMRVD